MGTRKLRTAANYGGSHLQAISEDVLSERTYSRAMRTDIVLAMKLLRNAPEMYKIVLAMDAYIDAGCADLDPFKPMCRRIINDVEGKCR